MRLPRTLIVVVIGLSACTTPAPSVAPTGNGWNFDTVRVEARRRAQDPWQSYPTRIAGNGVTQGVPEDRTSDYGGSSDWPRLRATGFFRVEKTDGRWWLVTPDGERFIHAGVAGVTPGGSKAAKTALAQRYGSQETWARTTAQWLRDNGFNGGGAWSDTTFLGKPAFRTPHARIVNFMSDYGKQRGGTFLKPGHTGYPNDAIFVFDPEFRTFADTYAAKLAVEANNPWLIGWFSDNEMPLYDKTLDRFLGLPAGDPGAIEAARWLAARQGRVQPDPRAITADDRAAFVGYVYETYLEIVSGALRRHDPNHLYLGSRLHADELQNRYVFAAAGRFLDVVSINFYRSWAPDPGLLRNWETWSGKPVLITEWYTKGEDSGLPNTTGAGWLVRNQADRGRHYQNFVLTLLESRCVVGWHWFKYQDNDPDDPNAEASNRDANKGLVDLRFAPYPALVEAARTLNRRKYALIRWLDAPR